MYDLSASDSVHRSSIFSDRSSTLHCTILKATKYNFAPVFFGSWRNTCIWFGFDPYPYTWSDAALDWRKMTFTLSLTSKLAVYDIYQTSENLHFSSSDWLCTAWKETFAFVFRYFRHTRQLNGSDKQASAAKKKVPWRCMYSRADMYSNFFAHSARANPYLLSQFGVSAAFSESPPFIFSLFWRFFSFFGRAAR